MTIIFSARRADRMVGKVLRALPTVFSNEWAHLYDGGRFAQKGELDTLLREARKRALRAGRKALRAGLARPVYRVDVLGLSPWWAIRVWAGYEPAETWVEIVSIR